MSGVYPRRPVAVKFPMAGPGSLGQEALLRTLEADEAEVHAPCDAGMK